jgi:hypothetical protein
MSTPQNYYIVDTNRDPIIHIAKDDTSFMKYFVKNIDKFGYVFSAMLFTESNFKKLLPKIFNNVESFEDKNLSRTLKKIKKVVKEMTFSEFSGKCDGECTDGNCEPYVMICKMTSDEFVYIG